MKIIRCVLLSGGLDSTASLHWALEKADPVVAVGFYYHQPHAIAELRAAREIAKRRTVPLEVLTLPNMGPLNPLPGRTNCGISRAFVPGRNAVFLARASAHVVRHDTELALVMGANADDARGFPDCRQPFFDAQATALSAAFEGMAAMRIETPWLERSKADIVKWCASRKNALDDIRLSVSCYRGARCGECDPCVLRANAFLAAGIEDRPT